MYFRAFRLVASDSVNLSRKQKPCRKSSYWVLDNFTWTQTLANDLTYPSWKRCHGKPTSSLPPTVGMLMVYWSSSI